MFLQSIPLTKNFCSAIPSRRSTLFSRAIQRLVSHLWDLDPLPSSLPNKIEFVSWLKVASVVQRTVISVLAARRFFSLAKLEVVSGEKIGYHSDVKYFDFFIRLQDLDGKENKFSRKISKAFLKFLPVIKICIEQSLRIQISCHKIEKSNYKRNVDAAVLLCILLKIASNFFYGD